MYCCNQAFSDFAALAGLRGGAPLLTDWFLFDSIVSRVCHVCKWVCVRGMGMDVFPKQSYGYGFDIRNGVNNASLGVSLRRNGVGMCLKDNYGKLLNSVPKNDLRTLV